MKAKAVTIRIPHDLWVDLRRAQEEGRIKSIQKACIAGLQCITAAKDAKKERR